MAWGDSQPVISPLQHMARAQPPRSMYKGQEQARVMALCVKGPSAQYEFKFQNPLWLKERTSPQNLPCDLHMFSLARARAHTHT